MKKTKLGISVGLLICAIYFLSYFSFLASVGLVLYVLIKEEDAWLRKSSIKALVIILFFMVLSTILGYVQTALITGYNGINFIPVEFINNIVTFIRNLTNSTFSFISFAINLLEFIIIFVCATRALKGKDIKFSIADKLISEHYTDSSEA